MSDLKAKYQRPEGALIEKTLKGPPKVTMRELARRIEMSDARIRQIVNGYHPQGDQVLRVVGPAETVARMAMAIGLGADDLAEVGREDAAAVIREHQAEHPDNPEMVESLVETDAIFQELKEWLLGVPNGTWPGRPPTSGLTFWSSEQMLDVLTDRERGHRETIAWHVARYERLKAKHLALESEVSAPDARIGLAVAADEQEQSIAGEAEQLQEP